MKIKLELLIIAIAFTTAAYNQVPSLSNPTPSFSAIIVDNIDSSAAWYESILGMKVKTKPDAPLPFKVVILESPHYELELIENRSWPAREELLKGKPEGTHIRGFFKIGFKVSNMDEFIGYLKSLRINIGRIYNDPAGKRNFLIPDPDGNLLQFFE